MSPRTCGISPGMFTPDAVRETREALAKIERKLGVPVLIETVETLKGETIDEVASRLARQSGAQGVFILVARKETKIEVLASRRYTEALPRPARDQGSLGIHRGLPQEGLRRRPARGHRGT